MNQRQRIAAIIAAGSGDAAHAAGDLLFVQTGTVHGGARDPAANHHRRTKPRKNEPGHTVLSAELPIKLSSPAVPGREQVPPRGGASWLYTTLAPGGRSPPTFPGQRRGSNFLQGGLEPVCDWSPSVTRS
jgi:hypothetical protein